MLWKILSFPKVFTPEPPGGPYGVFMHFKDTAPCVWQEGAALTRIPAWPSRASAGPQPALPHGTSQGVTCPPAWGSPAQVQLKVCQALTHW